MNAEKSSASSENEKTVLNGWIMLPVTIAGLIGSVTWLLHSVGGEGHPDWWQFAGAILAELASIIFLIGFFTLQPNEARVLLLFGAYRGTVRRSGFHWGNPFYSNGGKG